MASGLAVGFPERGHALERTLHVDNTREYSQPWLSPAVCMPTEPFPLLYLPLDSQIQGFDVSNPALHRQQSGENKSGRGMAFLRCDRCCSRVAPPQRLHPPFVFLSRCPATLSYCKVDCICKGTDAHANDLLGFMFSRQEPGI